MNEDPSSKRLGRGLAALIGEMDKPAAEAARTPVPIDVPCRSSSSRPIRATRVAFGEADLEDLAAVDPPARRGPADRGQAVARGRALRAHRRRAALARRAARRAGNEIPVIVREVDDRTALELAIVENVQRSDLNPVEEALGYQQLIDEHNYVQTDLGQVIGKSRSHVANTLRLLKLPDVVRQMLVDGALSAGHARTLITAADPARLAKRIAREGLSVRQAEALAQKGTVPPKPRQTRHAAEKDSDTLALEALLSDVTGLKVTIDHRDQGGQVRIDYSTLEQLDDVCRRLQSEHI
jgi:ParB family chromosome partitioning protein